MKFEIKRFAYHIFHQLSGLSSYLSFRFDVYRKIPQDLTEPTLSGAIISLLCIVSIVVLLVIELNDYLSTEMYDFLFLFFL